MASKGKQIGTSSEISSQARSHRKRTRGEDESYDKLSEQIGEVATAIKKLSDDRLDEVMLATAFDYLLEKEKLAKTFMAKNDRLRRVWLEDFSRKNA